jgi:hypothetical protein
MARRKETLSWEIEEDVKNEMCARKKMMAAERNA